MHVLPPPSERPRMSKDNKAKPPGPQPLRDTRKILEALKQHPIWQAQQAAIAKLRKAAGGDAEPETGEQASPELTTAPTTEPVVEPANEPTPLPAAAETTPLASEPAADKEPEQ